MGELTRDTPKPMIPVAGTPLLERTVELLSAHGISEIFLSAFYKSDVIARHFTSAGAAGSSRSSDVGARGVYGTRIVCEPEPLGTAGPLHLLKSELDEHFLVVYGDEFLDVNIGSLVDAHLRKGALATILARPSLRPYQDHLIETDADDRVLDIDYMKGRKRQNLGNMGVYACSKDILSLIPQRKCGFSEDVFPAAIAQGLPVYAHRMEHSGYVEDVGFPERIALVEDYLRHRDLIALARRDRRRIETLFLDRDGVLIEDYDHIARQDDVRILDGAIEGLRLLNQHGIKTVMTTNQSVIGRGRLTESGLKELHHYLEGLLNAHDVHVDATYYCPHFPDTAKDGVVPEYNCYCECRKPRPGMMLKAMDELGLDLRACAMVGDRPSDIDAAYNAGIRSIRVGNVEPFDRVPDARCRDLYDAARLVVEGRL
jgi:D-glycero-D-manno-heptose 1,7-bisphosphate phosphatase